MLHAFETLASVAPLRTEPFLLHAALTERKGHLQQADSLLKQARRRDPRSIAALYLLADVYLREDKVADALEAIGILARLVPNADVQLIPSLAAFAQTPGAQNQLAAVLKGNPNLKPPLLDALSADPGNARLVLELAGSDLYSQADISKVWKSRLVNAFIGKGDYRQGYNVWRIFAKLPANSPPLLYNGDFRRTSAPPPFDWTYASTSEGVAEPSAGKLRVLYYGRQDSILASQLLMLRPGTYQFQAPVQGPTAPNALAWTLTCVGSDSPLMQLPVRPATAGRFTVPPKCQAQSLALNGQSQESPQNSDVQLGPVSLQRVDG